MQCHQRVEDCDITLTGFKGSAYRLDEGLVDFQIVVAGGDAERHVVAAGYDAGMATSVAAL